MAVKVTIHAKTDTSSERTAQHAEGKAVFVREGHLFIATGTANTAPIIAIYAPGKWASAEVTSA